MKIYKKLWWGAVILLSVWGQPVSGQAQTKTVRSRETFWLGYMTSARVTEKYSVWNDFHFVPETFVVARTGLTRHLCRVNLTGGYAFLLLTPGSGYTSLNRHEQRPWGQAFFSGPLGNSWVLSQRVRYDARFRQQVSSGEITDGYNFHNRVRYQVNLRRNFRPVWQEKLVPFVALSDEVLVNFGKEIVYNSFDQNRISLAIGFQKQKQQIQFGYMNRFAQTGPGNYLQDHLLLVWVTQTFDLRKKNKAE